MRERKIENKRDILFDVLVSLDYKLLIGIHIKRFTLLQHTSRALYFEARPFIGKTERVYKYTQRVWLPRRYNLHRPPAIWLQIQMQTNGTHAVGQSRGRPIAPSMGNLEASEGLVGNSSLLDILPLEAS